MTEPAFELTAELETQEAPGNAWEPMTQRRDTGRPQSGTSHPERRRRRGWATIDP